MTKYKFGELFTYDYIDGDNTTIGGCIEYVNVIILKEITPFILANEFFNMALLDMNTGVFKFYKNPEDSEGLMYMIN